MNLVHSTFLNTDSGRSLKDVNATIKRYTPDGSSTHGTPASFFNSNMPTKYRLAFSMPTPAPRFQYRSYVTWYAHEPARTTRERAMMRSKAVPDYALYIDWESEPPRAAVQCPE